MTVVYERDETGWWVAQVRERPEVVTQGRTLAEARRRIREALALVLGSAAAASDADLVDDIRLPPGVRRALRDVEASRTRVERERGRLSNATRTAVSTLVRGIGLSTRDAGELLGLSHQRVQQLAPSARSRSAARDRGSGLGSARRGAPGRS